MKLSQVFSKVKTLTGYSFIQTNHATIQVHTYAADASDAQATEQMLKALAPIDHIFITASGSAPATGIVDTPPEIASAAFSRFWLSYNALHSAPGFVLPVQARCYLAVVVVVPLPDMESGERYTTVLRH